MRRHSLRIFTIACWSFMPLLAAAQTEWTPYVSERLLHNSNVFGFSSRDEALGEIGDSRMDDAIRQETAGLNWAFENHRTRWSVEAEASQYDHQYFTELDRSESTLGGRGAWRLSGDSEIELDYRNERRLGPFTERNTAQLAMEREQSGGLGLSLAPGGFWMTELAIRSYQLDAPLPDRPQFSLSEQLARAELRAADGPGLRLGIAGEWLQGRYQGAPDLERFRLFTLAATARYSLADVIGLRAEVGRTRRSVERGDAADLDSWHYRLTASRRLTGLTWLYLYGDRRQVSYLGGPAAIVEDNQGLSLSWHPAYTAAVVLAIDALQTDFREAPDFPGREDELVSATLRVEYRFLRYLELRPAISWSKRDSNYPLERFEQLLLGVELRLHLRQPAPRPEG